MGLSHTKEDDQVPFLENNEREDDAKAAIQEAQRSRRLFLIVILLSLIIHLILSLLWFKPWHSSSPVTKDTQKPSSLYSMCPHALISKITAYRSDPFHSAIRTKIEQWPDDAWVNSVYTGPPRRELDMAWNKLQTGRA